MQLGSNDLVDSDPLHVGSAIDDCVRLLHDTYGILVVCMCQSLMRQGEVVFNRKAKLLTKYLRVDLDPVPYAMFFWAIGDFGAQLRTFTHVLVCISVHWVRKNTIVVLEEQS